MILVSGPTSTHRRFLGSGYFGHLVTPSGGHRMTPIIEGGAPWACDNDAFTKAGFDPAAFRRMLARVEGLPGCRFVACPDVPLDARGTLARFEAWAPEIAAAALPVALVGQDGCEDLELPWCRFDALFIGGGDAWKKSAAAMCLTERARLAGKWVHVGRVNTLRRIRKVWDWGTVDSVDGGCHSRWPEKFFPRSIAWIRALERQPVFWEPGGDGRRPGPRRDTP